MAQQHKLHPVIDALSYPASGQDFITEARNQGLPENFCNEITPMIQAEKFGSSQELERWVANNITPHMAGQLGGATVHDLIERAKKTA